MATFLLSNQELYTHCTHFAFLIWCIRHSVLVCELIVSSYFEVPSCARRRCTKRCFISSCACGIDGPTSPTPPARATLPTTPSTHTSPRRATSPRLPPKSRCSTSRWNSPRVSSPFHRATASGSSVRTMCAWSTNCWSSPGGTAIWCV